MVLNSFSRRVGQGRCEFIGHLKFTKKARGGKRTRKPFLSRSLERWETILLLSLNWHD